ncbi:hypothetical protein PF008_g28963 [Phytophthora fragariae]|uniref:Uncharacterized protein n=1 Tax=Phytophthora fragariae TaxID=53985 RepID=A0A6G0Q9S3_9STRA|nr:hypothetical protein PF008_g28963 [Phytophthora fragariae]
MPVQVAVKIGEIGRTSRTNVRVNENCFTFDQDSDDFERLVAKTEAIVDAALKEYEPKTTRADPSVYLKLGVKAPQREGWQFRRATGLLALTVHTNCQRRSKPGPLVMELIVFVAKEQSGIRRAITNRIEEASREIDLHLSERPDIAVGEITRTHWAISRARQPEGTTIATPDNATFRQAQHIDAMRATLVQPDEEQAAQTLFVSLNGSTPMGLTIDVGELRQLLGIPSYNFLAQGIFTEFQPPAETSEDVPDSDNQQ